MATSKTTASSAVTSAKRLLLLTGVPGVGKTTLMGKLHKALGAEGVNCSGFITEEVRVGGRRVGFDVVTMMGQRGQLARISEQTDRLPGTQHRDYKVGQYSVQLLSFEQIALPTLHIPRRPTQETQPDRKVFLVDEIGKMELFSNGFIQAVRHLLSQPNVTLVATIPVPKGRPLNFVEEIRSRPEAQIFEVTHANRDILLEDLLSAVTAPAS